ncbi:recombinase family protein [Citrobacter freundii]|uniref:recombinase family protein n=1 Tax=Citrobacter freundii TaxID=546 RepID=UPI00131F5C5D|nr:recombinase family protein [Citrobacter freundii]EKV4073494.1 recombinase family protein [Citrobacter freundii]EKV5128509.1 recombinase family protein [Citrobacter freundii]EKW1511379.1 recombinase family protein [Citrobacter freundii]MBD5704337.1 recombinase family protein [Citrobacter freundii]MDH0999976.1 recombinase family protein [Citrobacter freundii]
MKPKLYSYVRFSSAKQREGNSLERQQDTALRIASRYDLELDTTAFHDLGMSAFKGKNAHEGKLSEFIKQIGIKVPVGSWLVVENLDRISRDDAWSALDIFKSILSKGIVIVTGMDEKVYKYADVKNNPTDLIISLLMFTRAHDESLTKKNRVESQARSLIRHNLTRKSGTPAKSIESVGQNVWWVDTKSGYVTPHPMYFSAAQKIIELKQSGETLLGIQRYLNKHYPAPKKRIYKDQTGQALTPKTEQWGKHLIRTFLNPTVHGQKVFTLDKRDESGAIMCDPDTDAPLKETLTIPDYYPALMSEIDYLTLSKLDRNRAVTRSSSKYPEGNPEPEIPLLSGIGILFCGKCGSFMFKSGSSKNKYRYICGSKIVQGKPCGKKGFTSYQLEHTVLQLISDHVWNNHQEDKTAWYESEIEKASEAVNTLYKLATLTDGLEELADQIKANKQKKVTLEREFQQYKISRSEIQTTGWEQFRHFDVHDTKNPNRKRIRLKVKQAIKRIDCYDIDERHDHFEVTFSDETKQRIVIKFNRNRSPGVSYVEAQTVNAHDLLKMQGLVLHSFIDELIEPEKFAQHIKDKQEVSILNPTFITELEDGVGKAEGDGMAIMVDGNKNKSYATVNGIKYEINSLEDLEKLSR